MTIAYSQQPGTPFALGTTTVTVTATDGRRNATTKTFQVTVVDTTPPVMTAPGDITAEATSPAGAVVFAADGDRRGVDPDDRVFAGSGTDVRARDDHGHGDGARTRAGNTTTKTFTVTVVDTTAPVITVPADITVEATSRCRCRRDVPADGERTRSAPTTITYSKTQGTTFALWTTTVTVTAKDAAGNTSTETFTRHRASTQPRR